jgi:hypothetical protein
MKNALFGFRKIICFILFVAALLVGLIVSVGTGEEQIMMAAGIFGAFAVNLCGGFIALMSGFKGSYAAGASPTTPPVP